MAGTKLAKPSEAATLSSSTSKPPARRSRCPTSQWIVRSGAEGGCRLVVSAVENAIERKLLTENPLTAIKKVKSSA